MWLVSSSVGPGAPAIEAAGGLGAGTASAGSGTAPPPAGTPPADGGAYAYTPVSREQLRRIFAMTVYFENTETKNRRPVAQYDFAERLGDGRGEQRGGRSPRD